MVTKGNSGISKTLFVSMDVLFIRKEVKGYQWFRSRILQEREGEDTPVFFFFFISNE